MEILIIRHADPDYANDTITPPGHREARQLAAALTDEELSAIYVSPLGRAQATARYTAKAKGMSTTTLDWMREVDAPGIYEHAAWELPGTHVLGQQELPTMENWADDPLFGASFKPFYQSIADGFDALLLTYGYRKTGHMYRVESSSPAKIALFCHKGTTLTLLSYLCHWPIQLLYPHCTMGTTAVTRLTLEETDDAWAVPRIQVMNDLSHTARKLD